MTDRPGGMKHIRNILPAFMFGMAGCPDAPIKDQPVLRIITMQTLRYDWRLPACIEHQDLVMHSLPDSGNLAGWTPPHLYLLCRACLPSPGLVEVLDKDGRVVSSRPLTGPYPDQPSM